MIDDARAMLLMAVALLATAICYWPGLHGGYLFDDMPNFVDNTDVHVTTADADDWRRAALASPASTFVRPLAMLSLAANYYFTQLDPFPLKLTNLCIHLANGLLLWRVLLALLGLWNARTPRPVAEYIVQIMALGVTSAWLLAPINVTAVLYVVQRMESMAQFFVLSGLLAYLHGRRQMLVSGRGVTMSASGLLLGTALGVLCKETAVLLPVYAALIELVLLRFDSRNPRERRLLQGIYLLILIAPAVVGLAWLLPRTLSDGAYIRRPFTLSERLLTECRVLIDYVRWTLIPDPRILSFYHDDIPLSRGWLSPPSTLACAIGIVAGLGAAIALHRRLPLVALGIGWFFAAHLLTATIIPLELVFEHRNYFASIGLLLAAAGLLAAIPARLHLARVGIPVIGILLFAGVTALRAQEWSHPVKLAVAEAGKHPDSPRANYELGRALIIASDYRLDSKLIAPAIAAFEKAGSLPGDGASAYASLIFVAGHLQKEAKPVWWQRLTEELRSQAPSIEAVTALRSLAQCQEKGPCEPDSRSMKAAFSAALAHPWPPTRLLSAYAVYAANSMGDYRLAEILLRRAIKRDPKNAIPRIQLASVLIAVAQYDDARQIIRGVDSSKLNVNQSQQLSAIEQKLPKIPMIQH